MRLNQAIAKTGLCSRRKADELIAAGKVRVNGAVCTDFALDVDAEQDQLEIEGQTLSFRQLSYVLLNKPPGFITTVSDEKGRKTVMQLLPPELRHLKPVGRLDRQSEGLLILTNDGQLALRLTHPRHHLPKVYAVRVEGTVTDRQLAQLRTGVPLEDGVTLPAEVLLKSRNKSCTNLEMTLTEGRNRQIRRMFEYLGYRVIRLVRLSIGGLQLGHVAPGTWRYLTSQEVSSLLTQSTE